MLVWRSTWCSCRKLKGNWVETSRVTWRDEGMVRRSSHWTSSSSKRRQWKLATSCQRMDCFWTRALQNSWERLCILYGQAGQRWKVLWKPDQLHPLDNSKLYWLMGRYRVIEFEERCWMTLESKGQRSYFHWTWVEQSLGWRGQMGWRSCECNGRDWGWWWQGAWNQVNESWICSQIVDWLLCWTLQWTGRAEQGWEESSKES